MAKFNFEAMSSAGKKTKGSIEATSVDEATKKLRAKGMFPTKVTGGKAGKKVAAAAPVGKKKAKGVVGGVDQKQLTMFTRQLATLQDAGLPIVRSLSLLEDQMKPGLLKNALMDVGDDVNSGSTFSDALAKHPKCFDNLYVNMVKAGEAGGVLDTIMERLADFREKAAKLKNQMISAMVYPVSVMTIAGLILVGIMLVIVPKFQKIFGDMGIELPGPTLLLLDLSRWMENYWYLIPVIPFSIWLVIKGIRSQQKGKFWTDWLFMKLPVAGEIYEKGAVSRFCRTTGTLIASGVPILEGLTIIRNASSNEVIRWAISEVHSGIKEGESMAGPMKATEVFDPLLVNMVDVGEETGEVAKMMNKIADGYDDDIENLVSAMMSLIEPLLIVGMGISVGFIVIALFMPMISMMGSM